MASFSLIPYLDPKLHLFDDISVSDSDISILSDPFNDLESKPIPFRKRDLTGLDVFEAFEFSETFKNVVKIVHDPNKSLESMIAETTDKVRVRSVFTQLKKKVPMMVQIKVGALLNKVNIEMGEVPQEETFEPDEKKTWGDIKEEMIKSRVMMKNIRKLTEKERSRKLLLAQQEQEAYETMSGYWRMISEYDDFRITPPGYDVYNQREPHWLEIEPVPWEVMEFSRRKVLNWLEKHFKTY